LGSFHIQDKRKESIFNEIQSLNRAPFEFSSYETFEEFKCEDIGQNQSVSNKSVSEEEGEEFYSVKSQYIPE